MDAPRKRLSRKAIRAMAWGAGAVAFAFPWAALRLVPAPKAGAQAARPQVVVVPAGSRVIVTTGAPSGSTGVTVVRAKGATTAPAVTTTGASVPVVR